MTEAIKTSLFIATAAALTIAALMTQPGASVPKLFSDQGEIFYPHFKDPQTVKSIDVVDYDESTATARPFQVAFTKGRWVIPSHQNYAVDIGDRLNKTAGALIDLKKDQVQSDSPQDHAKYGVIDPIDSKVASLTGRGKRVTLSDASKVVLADFIFGKPVEGKPGWRYVRQPGQKRVYAVKTDADPSSKFADWVNAGLLRAPQQSMRKISINSYQIDEQQGTLANFESVQLVKAGSEWKMVGADGANKNAIAGVVNTLAALKIVDVKAKPPSLAEGLKTGQLELSLETMMSLRQRGFFLTPRGQIFANEGEMIIETTNGVNYVLRFGELASTQGENRYLFVIASFDPKRAAAYSGDAAAGERTAKELTAKFADWYYIISGQDFAKLRLRKKDQ